METHFYLQFYTTSFIVFDHFSDNFEICVFDDLCDIDEIFNQF